MQTGAVVCSLTMLRTLIVADLHLGGAGQNDLTGRPDACARLLNALSGADRLVLLGDVLELRDCTQDGAIATAAPFFDALGEALSGREVVVIPGNHDHALVARWLGERRAQAMQVPLGLAEPIEPERASPILEALSERASPARLTASYPGLWIREDVYAIHGHYMDCHMKPVTAERLAIAAMMRLLGRPGAAAGSGAAAGAGVVEEYESVIGPVYALLESLGQRAALETHAADHDPARVVHEAALLPARHAAASRRSAAPVWDLPARGIREAARVLAPPLIAAVLGRPKAGSPRIGLPGDALLRAELVAMREVLDRLRVSARHVVFGHTHRAGPLPGSNPREWHIEGTSLLNCGAPVGQPPVVDGSASDRGEPGYCVVVEDDGPPVLSPL